jgi:hypothetical protein
MMGDDESTEGRKDGDPGRLIAGTGPGEEEEVQGGTATVDPEAKAESDAAAEDGDAKTEAEGKKDSKGKSKKKGGDDEVEAADGDE